MKSALSFLFLTFLFTSCTMFNGLFEEPNRLWIEVASAERQCIPPDYTSLEDAINQLEDDGIEVFDKDELNLVVCRACSCPTGTIYRAYITESDLDDAEELGWSRAS
ncbi:MAG: hypothetical protein JJ895_08640 [Balneolaceae bacterium]|nr:hypothetical protein [Balneolaceae bacterium]